MKTVLMAAVAAVLLFSPSAFATPYYHHSYWHHRAYYAHQAHCYYVRTAHGRRVYECHY
jgi:hypothetical protein